MAAIRIWLAGESGWMDSIRRSSASCRQDFHLWLPSEAFLIGDSQIWKPLQFNYANLPPRNFTFFTVFGRLAPGGHVRAGAGGA